MNFASCTVNLVTNPALQHIFICATIDTFTVFSQARIESRCAQIVFSSLTTEIRRKLGHLHVDDEFRTYDALVFYLLLYYFTLNAFVLTPSVNSMTTLDQHYEVFLFEELLLTNVAQRLLFTPFPVFLFFL